MNEVFILDDGTFFTYSTEVSQGIYETFKNDTSLNGVSDTTLKELLCVSSIF